MSLQEFQTLLEDATVHRSPVPRYDILCPHCAALQTRREPTDADFAQFDDTSQLIVSNFFAIANREQTDLSFLAFKDCDGCGKTLVYIGLGRASRAVVTPNNGCFYDQDFEHDASELEMVSCENNTQAQHWSVLTLHNVHFEGDTDSTPVDLELHTVGPFLTWGARQADSEHHRIRTYFEIASRIVELLIEMLDHRGTLPKNAAPI